MLPKTGRRHERAVAAGGGALRLRGDDGEIEGVFEESLVAPLLEKLCYSLVSRLAISHAKEPPLPPLTVL